MIPRLYPTSFGKGPLEKDRKVPRWRSTSCRRSHDLPGGLGKPVVGRRVTGEPLEPDMATRNAERPKGEKRELASRMLGNKHVRCAP